MGDPAARTSPRFSRWVLEPLFFALPGVVLLLFLYLAFGPIILVFLILWLALTTVLAFRLERKKLPIRFL